MLVMVFLCVGWLPGWYVNLPWQYYPHQFPSVLQVVRHQFHCLLPVTTPPLFTVFSVFCQWPPHHLSLSSLSSASDHPTTCHCILCLLPVTTPPLSLSPLSSASDHPTTFSLSPLSPASGHPTIVIVSSVFCLWPPHHFSLSPLSSASDHPPLFHCLLCLLPVTTHHLFTVSSASCQWPHPTFTVSVIDHPPLSAFCQWCGTQQDKPNQTQSNQKTPKNNTIRPNTQWDTITHIMCALLLGRTTDFLEIRFFKFIFEVFLFLLERSLIST